MQNSQRRKRSGLPEDACVFIHTVNQRLCVSYGLDHELEVLLTLIEEWSDPALGFAAGEHVKHQYIRIEIDVEQEVKRRFRKLDGLRGGNVSPKGKILGCKEVKLEFVVVVLVGKILQHLDDLAVVLQLLDEFFNDKMLLLVLDREDETHGLGLFVWKVPT